MDLRERLSALLADDLTIERELGGGGMSLVFLARDRRLGRRIVIKVIAPELAAAMSSGRFDREIQLAASLQQANIVPLLTAGAAEEIRYYTMPFVEGESLRARLARGPLSEVETISILRDVARALLYAHERGVVHRDIKPDNVLLSGESAVVTDFGIAKAITASRTMVGDGSSSLTQMGTAIGTPAYMAPEQATGDPATDHRADLYALGCMAFELLTGSPPFLGRSVHQLMTAHLTEPPPSLASRRPGIDAGLEALVTACLAKEPAQRPANAREVLRQLELIGSGAAREAAASVLAQRPRLLAQALGIWGMVFGATWLLAKAAVVGIGLPTWTVPLAVGIAVLGLPAVLITWFIQRTARAALLTTPAFTPRGGTVVRGTMATLALTVSPHVSWRRTRRAGIGAAALLVLSLSTVLVLRQFGLGPAASLLAAGAIRGDARVLVAQFSTTASDTSLATVVAQAMRTALGQSEAIRLVTPAEIAAGLARMTLPPTTPLTATTAQELATREEIPLLLTGQIASLGSGFVVSVNLVAADSGNVLTSVQRGADGPGTLLDAIDELARDLRSRIGESLRSVARAPRLQRATTASLDALREYTRGVEIGDLRGDFLAAIPLLERAVTIDSTFASAWRKLAVYRFNVGASESQILAATVAAYRHRDRSAGLERSQIEAYYLERLSTHEAMALYARTPGLSQNNHALMLLGRGRYAAAESVVTAEITGAPAGQPPIIQLYVQLVRSQIQQGKLEAARTSYAAMRQAFPGAWYTEMVGMWLGWSVGGIDSVPRLSSEALGSTHLPQRANGAQMAAMYALARGQVRRHGPLLASMLTLADSAGSGIDGLRLRIDHTVAFARLLRVPAAGIRELETLRRTLQKSELSAIDRHDLAFAIAFARLGAVSEATAAIERYERGTTQEERLLQWGAWQGAQGELALARGDAAGALTALRRAIDADSGNLAVVGSLDLDDRFARAFDAVGQRDSAVAVLERMLRPADLNGAERLGGIWPDALRRLAALHEELGRPAEARRRYEEFLRLWRDADPELQPQVAEVRARLALLPSR